MKGKGKKRVTRAYQILGQNLRALRLAACYSQAELAQKLGVSFQQVQKYESGVNRLPLDTMITLRDLLGVSYEDLFAGMTRQEAAETAAAAAAPPHTLLNDLHGYDAITQKICRQVMAINDIALKKKISRIVAIIAA